MLISQLNQVYQPLEDKLRQLQSILSSLPNRLRVGWFNGHYCRNSQDGWEYCAFPIPEVDVLDLCDVEIHLDHICITTKLHRDDALGFDYQKLNFIPFEAYGVEDYLLDFYRKGLTMKEFRRNIQQSEETEIGFSFILPLETKPEQITNLITLLQQEGFYY